MKDIGKKITDRIAKNGMFSPGSTVLCAVSGGADSMCLLHFLHTNREELSIKVAVAHYEHGLRGEESVRDLHFIEDWCVEREIPFLSERGNVTAYARLNRLSTEEAARTLRYDFLVRAAEALSCDVIATAHTMDDNAETVLLNMTRGAGSKGLAGIPPVRDRFVRPLLSLTRWEIEEYIREHGVAHVEDSSNASDDYTRNLIRHHVMPVLKECNPEISAVMEHTCEILRQDDACLSEIADDFIAGNLDLKRSLPTAALLALPRAVSSRVIRHLCPQPLHYKHVEAALSLAEKTQRSFLNLPGIVLEVEQGRLIFGSGEIPSFPDTELVPGEIVRIPSAGIQVRTEISVFPGKVNGLFKPFCLKCDEIYGRVFLTSRKSGDTIRLYQRGCTKTLKKLYAENRLTQRERILMPVIRDDLGVLAVYGLAVGERGIPSPGDSVYAISIDSLET